MTIRRRRCQHGRTCLEKYWALLDAAETRVISAPPRNPGEPPTSKLKPTQLSLEESGAEQDLTGLEYRQGDAKFESVERNSMLERFANHLADKYGERLVVPEWARAEAKCPECDDAQARLRKCASSRTVCARRKNRRTCKGKRLL